MAPRSSTNTKRWSVADWAKLIEGAKLVAKPPAQAEARKERRLRKDLFTGHLH